MAVLTSRQTPLRPFSRRHRIRRFPTKRSRRELFVAAAAASIVRGADRKWEPVQLAHKHGAIEVIFAPGEVEAGRETVIAWIREAMESVIAYFGRFPVPIAKIQVTPSEGRRGAFGGVTYPQTPALTEISVGTTTLAGHLESDWIMTHELVHMALPSVARRHHWIEEGVASYVEPIARLHRGRLTASAVWNEMVQGMPKGQPRDGDRGLDRTPTWGRTYWGGAMFCLLADVRIRQATRNQMGLQHALRGVLAAGGNIQQDWALSRVVRTGDETVGATVLTDLYREMGDAPVRVPLDELWAKLGVRGSSLDDEAPLATVRRAIETRV